MASLQLQQDTPPSLPRPLTFASPDMDSTCTLASQAAQAMASHEELCADKRLFIKTLTRFGNQLGVPPHVIKEAGRDIDLHRAYLEVTSRGGWPAVMALQQLGDVAKQMGIPHTRVHELQNVYTQLIQHFERVYFLRLGNCAADLVPSGLRQDQHSPWQELHDQSGLHARSVPAPDSILPYPFHSDSANGIPGPTSHAYSLPPLLTPTHQRHPHEPYDIPLDDYMCAFRREHALTPALLDQRSIPGALVSSPGPGPGSKQEQFGVKVLEECGPYYSAAAPGQPPASSPWVNKVSPSTCVVPSVFPHHVAYDPNIMGVGPAGGLDGIPGASDGGASTITADSAGGRLTPMQQELPPGLAGRPMSSFAYFMAQLESVPDILHGRPVPEVAEEMWDIMTEDEKAPYRELSRRDHERWIWSGLAAEKEQCFVAPHSPVPVSPSIDIDRGYDCLLEALASEQHVDCEVLGIGGP